MAVQAFDFTSGKVLDPKRHQSVLFSADEQCVSVLSNLLKERHIQIVLSTASMAEALSCVKKSKVGVFYLDADIDGLDSLALLQTLKKAFPAFKVVLMSGSITKESAAESMKLGAEGVLLKPLNSEAVVALLGRLK